MWGSEHGTDPERIWNSRHLLPLSHVKAGVVATVELTPPPGRESSGDDSASRRPEAGGCDRDRRGRDLPSLGLATGSRQPFVGPNPTVLSRIRRVARRTRSRPFCMICTYFGTWTSHERHASHARGRWFETTRAHQKALISRHFCRGAAEPWDLESRTAGGSSLPRLEGPPRPNMGESAGPSPGARRVAGGSPAVAAAPVRAPAWRTLTLDRRARGRRHGPRAGHRRPRARPRQARRGRRGGVRIAMTARSARRDGGARR